MPTTKRLSIRTGVVGAWAVMVGFVIVVVADRLVSLFNDGSTAPTSLTTAGVPIGNAVSGLLVGLYNGGTTSVFVGILLIFIGWYQLLTFS